MKSIGIALIALVSGAQSWRLEAELGSPGPNYGGSEEERQIFRQASNNPNATTTMLVNIGSNQIELRVNVSEFGLPGVSSSIQNPRAVLSTYDLKYAMDSSFNSTFENPGPGCFSLAGSGFSSSVSSKAGDHGDCTSALGQNCVSALQGVSPDCSSSVRIPDVCESAFQGTTGVYGFEFGSSNYTTSPCGIFANNTAALSSSDSSKVYDQQAQGMHFMLFRNGNRPAVPVCIRAATSAAVSWRSVSQMAVFIPAALTVVWSLA